MTGTSLLPFYSADTMTKLVRTLLQCKDKHNIYFIKQIFDSLNNLFGNRKTQATDALRFLLFEQVPVHSCCRSDTMHQQSYSNKVGQPQSVMLIFSYFSIPQQLTPSGRLTDWRLSTPVCYPDFSLTSLSDKTIRKSSDYRLVREKICRPRDNPATAPS